MGQKVHPNAFRLGVTQSWNSRWFSDKNYKEFFIKDHKIKKFLVNKLPDAGIARIEIERSSDNTKVVVKTSKPGIIIGRSGAAIDQLREELSKKFEEKIEVKVQEIRRPDLEAMIVAQNVASALENRVSYRRAAKAAVQRSMEVGAQGIKIRIAGRLNGAEIARNETFKDGNIPLHTIRADIDYAFAEANTTYGVIGIKVWICKGLIFKSEEAGGAREEVERRVEEALDAKPLPKRKQNKQAKK